MVIEGSFILLCSPFYVLIKRKKKCVFFLCVFFFFFFFVVVVVGSSCCYFFNGKLPEKHEVTSLLRCFHNKSQFAV